ncbi:MAG: murB [Gammaproteobacteria bacterium]|jgi:UDP-N-acetylmuramate dehydrogenase|nr:murB [Gammaproteobacteria bacterium]
MTESIPSLRGELRYDEPLAKHTSWHVGGNARQVYKPADLQDLSVFLSTLPEKETIIWLGLGSNILIRSGGINGTVILTQGGLNELIAQDNGAVRVEAGVTCAKLAKFCAKTNLEKGAFFAGIPGTVGGALAMNAGAFGGETWEYVTAVETIDRQGNIQKKSREDFEIAYREVKRKENEWFVAGHFLFPLGDGEKANREIKALLKKRGETQPIGEFSCGSVFRNPPGDYAARLIESCGLKGKTIGGAVVSPKHANFIINKAGATAADIEQLIYLVQQTVKAETGVSLIKECHIIGDE